MFVQVRRLRGQLLSILSIEGRREVAAYLAETFIASGEVAPKRLFARMGSAVDGCATSALK